MESDSFVREFEQLSGGAGMGLIQFLSSLNRRRTLMKPLWYFGKKKIKNWKKRRDKKNKKSQHSLGMTRDLFFKITCQYTTEE